MKKSLALLLILLMEVGTMMAQSYDALWKEVETAGMKDLPQTEIKFLKQIRTKAKREKAYGHLLAAELRTANLQQSIAPDSLASEHARLLKEAQQLEQTDKVAASVYYCALAHFLGADVYPDGDDLVIDATDDDAEKTLKKAVATYREKAISHPELLAKTKYDAYTPLIEKGVDAKIFNNDLLHVIGFETRNYALLDRYYNAVGNCDAACYAALQTSSTIADLDSLIEVYGDQDICAEVAIKRYERMQDDERFTAQAKVAFLQKSIERWKGWKRINLLVNELERLQRPMVVANFDRRVFTTAQLKQGGRAMKNADIYDQPSAVKVKLRNVSNLTFTVTRTTLDGTTSLRTSSPNDLAKIKAACQTATRIQDIRNYRNHPAYEEFSDTFILPELSAGVYLVEYASTDKNIAPTAELIFVSDLYVLAERLPKNQLHYAVVNAITGQPIAGAKLKLTLHTYSNDKAETALLTTDRDGQATYTLKSRSASAEVYAYTEQDKAYPASELWTAYNITSQDRQRAEIDLFTDRSLYRPGQTVKVALLTYVQDNDQLTTTPRTGRNIKVELRDANYQVVDTKTATTDEYGAASFSFELPQKGRTGSYFLRTAGEDTAFAQTQITVEEYKQPTFFAEFQPYTKTYQPAENITLTGNAKTFSGVKVAGAKVEYTITRRIARYWWWGNDAETHIGSGVLTTNADGTFSLPLTLTLPDDAKNRNQAYLFHVSAKVTDTAGETHEAVITLPIAYKRALLAIEMSNTCRADEPHSPTIVYRNVAGEKVDALVQYAIAPYNNKVDDANQIPEFAKFLTVRTNTPLTLPQLKSGKYCLRAICEGDTIDHDFTVFSLTDTRPATPTDDWFYQSAETFPADGAPVYLQVGSSAKDQHIFFTLFTHKKGVLRQGIIRQSNAIHTERLTYQPEYGDGIFFSYAWVKNGKLFQHTAKITRPHPDKTLNVKWKTFRNRLEPGTTETWQLSVSRPDGTPVQAQLMASLYDKSLDQIMPHAWMFGIDFTDNLPHSFWNGMRPASFDLSLFGKLNFVTIKPLRFATFNRNYVDQILGTAFYESAQPMVMRSAKTARVESFDANVAMENAGENSIDYAGDMPLDSKAKGGGEKAETPPSTPLDPQTALRKNLRETAFFYPQMETQSDGELTLSFQVPEAMTTWKFLAIVHDKAFNYGQLSEEVITQKAVMLQPHLPRFVRKGDKAQISVRLTNTQAHAADGVTTLEIIDPVTDAVLYSERKGYLLPADTTVITDFSLEALLADRQLSPLSDGQTLVIVRLMAEGKQYADGEQHYLAILPNDAWVTNALAFSQNQAGTLPINLGKLLPADAKNPRLTIEYTNNPAWLMVQALPYVAKANSENAISLSAAYYVNRLGEKLLQSSPVLQKEIERWGRDTKKSDALLSPLSRNEDLKSVDLDETPWVADAKNETENRLLLKYFFDTNEMTYRLKETLEALRDLQNADGSVAWWKGMQGNLYMTTEVVKSLVRLNVLTAQPDPETTAFIKAAFGYLDREVARRVKEMKAEAKQLKQKTYITDDLCDYLYISGLAARPITEDMRYLLRLLAEKPVELTIYGKANTAIILARHGYAKKAKEYLESIRQYTVYREEMGRYFDTRKAQLTWRDYKIPTQVAAIEAFKILAPTDQQTIGELQRWLLQSKRTQAWDTPVNAIDAIWAFLHGATSQLEAAPTARITLDGRELVASEAQSGLGYVKRSSNLSDPAVAGRPETVVIEKSSKGTSWGAVYVQFFQPLATVQASGAELRVERDLFRVAADGSRTPISATKLNVGDKVVVRLTITAARDYDFVQLTDKRPACFEPTSQLSGYQYNGRASYYLVPRQTATQYFFDTLPKGVHTIETTYFVDRQGDYQMGTATIECAYAPEYAGHTAGGNVKCF